MQALRVNTKKAKCYGWFDQPSNRLTDIAGFTVAFTRLKRYDGPKILYDLTRRYPMSTSIKCLTKTWGMHF